MSKGNYGVTVHLQGAEGDIHTKAKYLDRQKHGDTVVVQIDGITFFMDPAQVRQVVRTLALDATLLDVEVLDAEVTV